MRLCQKDGSNSILGHMSGAVQKGSQRLLRISTAENQSNGCRGVGVPGGCYIKELS